MLVRIKPMATLAAGLCAILLSGCFMKEKPADKPNIILILADDLGWSDIGCYGSEIATPNLDNLAKNGLRFTQFHNTSKCFPSRACLLTGVYAQDCGYDTGFKNPIKNAITLGELFQSAGYRTYWAGKHHGIENPVTRGFNHYFGLKDGACNHFNPGKKREGEPQPAQKKDNRAWCIDDQLFSPYTPVEKDFYTTDYFTNYALEYLEDAKQKENPFFLYLAYTAPHDPLMAWPEDIQKYEGKYDDGYESIRQKRYEKQMKEGLINSSFKLSPPLSKAVWENLDAEEKDFESSKMEVYAAMIDRLDQNIGRVLEKLTDLDMKDNTIILFISDNGASAEMVNLRNDDDSAPAGSMGRWLSLGEKWANVSNTPFRYYKNYSYEGGINTPLIAFWPGVISANTFTDFPGHFIDFMATFADITGAEYPMSYGGQEIIPMRGQSLLPVFQGEETRRDGPLFWEWRDGAAMRLDEWKIVRHGREKSWDLYNLEKDPTEIKNMASEFPETLEIMDSLFQDWREGIPEPR